MSRQTAWVLLLGAAALALPVPAHDQVPGPDQGAPILLRGGDLYTVSGGVLASTDLLFADGRIVGIGPDLAVPDGAEVIVVSGKRVYPGLIAPNTTLGLIEIGAVRATNDRAEVGEITPEAAAHIAYNPDSELIPSVRAHGITTAQVAPIGSLIRGRSLLTRLDGWTKEDSAIRLVDGLHLEWPGVAVRSGRRVRESAEAQREAMAEQRRSLRAAFHTARAYRLAREADPETPVDPRQEAMLPVLRGELPLFVTANDYRQIVEALAFAEEQQVRMILVGGAESYLLTDRLKRSDVPVIVGSTTALPFRTGDAYDQRHRLPALLHEAGVRFCLSHLTWGAWAVRDLPLQAGHAVAYGLPEDAALRALTLSTAEILGIDEEQGSLDVGKSATLFVSDGDVIDVLGQKISLMFIDGRRVDLDNRHRELYRKYAQKPPID